jgi:hypothetical protein
LPAWQGYSRLDVDGTSGHREVAGKSVSYVGLGEKAVGADGVEPDQDRDQGDCATSVTPKPWQAHCVRLSPPRVSR